jgi:hypothetical protein
MKKRRASGVWPDIEQAIVGSFRLADHPEVGQTGQYKGVYRYRSGETVNFP